MHASTRFSTITALPSLLLVVAVVGMFIFESTFITNQVDDAYIAHQYSKNLAEGNGFVFNVGERVEGITNLLWALLIAQGVYLGSDAVSVSRYMGLLSGIGLLLASYWYAATILPRPYRFLAGLAPLIIYASNPFIAWVLSGLETGFYAMLIIAALAALNSGRRGLCMLCGVLALLTRPDGVLLVAAIVLTAYIEDYRTTRRLIPSRQTVLHGAIYFLTLLALTVFRILYFNDVVPNTFYAKVGGMPWWYGLDYVWTFLKDGPILLLLPFLFAAITCYRLLGGLIFGSLLLFYVVYVGGDFFANSRFLLPLLPILTAGTFFTLAWFLDRRQRFLTGVVLLCIVATPLWSMLAPTGKQGWEVIRWDFLAKRVASYPRQGLMSEDVLKAWITEVKAIEPPVQLIAALGIGRLRYWSEIPVLDMVGLTNKTIAKSPSDNSGTPLPGHYRSNSDYVLSRQPDVILIPKKGTRLWITLPAQVGLWEHPGLERDYRWNEHIKAYVRKNRG